MLFDVLMACAPLVAVAPAAIGVATSHAYFTSKGQLQRRLYRSLLLAEKLPVTTPGSRQIAADIDRVTLAVAYRAQYPQRGTEIARLALIGLGCWPRWSSTTDCCGSTPGGSTRSCS
jgi:hypothetical protein